MAWCPFAVHRPIPETTPGDPQYQPPITPRLSVVHSQAGRGSLYNYWRRTDIRLESHFWIGFDGKIEQYVDTQIRADANGQANRWREGSKYYGAISIETESSVSATERWTPAQAESLVRLLAWIGETHGIRPRVVDHKTDNGIGWHVMFGAPGPWTGVAKSCPGPARIPQLVDEVIPEVARRQGGHTTEPKPKEGFLSDLSAIEQRAVLNQINGLTQVWLPHVVERIARIEHHLNIDGHDKDRHGNSRPSYVFRVLQDTNAIRKAVEGES